MVCARPNSTSSDWVQDEDAGPVVAASRATHLTLKQAVHDELSPVIPDVKVTALSVGWAADRCFWNVTALLAIPLENYTVELNRPYAILMYFAVMDGLVDELASARETLYVCVNGVRVKVGIKQTKFCHVQTTVHPPHASSGRARRIDLNVVVTTTFLSLSLIVKGGLL
ncbi:hypothetical protein BaRGS_00028260 [Batillaria attramentaria]|uniref:Uncharacterized protein n=1 Tax=Batillaria attramentaria TaxID=370345 RepID=A0ABD0K0U8_9CAEN